MRTGIHVLTAKSGTILKSYVGAEATQNLVTKHPLKMTKVQCSILSVQ